MITEVVEKVVFDEVNVGIYNRKHVESLVNLPERMIQNNLRVKSKFYAPPTYMELIAPNSNIGFYNIGLERGRMHGLVVPEDLKYFQKTVEIVWLYELLLCPRSSEN